MMILTKIFNLSDLKQRRKSSNVNFVKKNSKPNKFWNGILMEFIHSKKILHVSIVENYLVEKIIWKGTSQECIWMYQKRNVIFVKNPLQPNLVWKDILKTFTLKWKKSKKRNTFVSFVTKVLLTRSIWGNISKKFMKIMKNSNAACVAKVLLNSYN